MDDDPRACREKAAGSDQSSPSTRARICWLLGRLGDAKALVDLQHMLRDEDLYVKVAALKALGQIGSESVIPVLKEAAASSNVLIRQAARDALKAAERVEHGDEKS